MTDGPGDKRGRRADTFLVEAGFAGSRTEAQNAIRLGFVSANGRPVRRPSKLLREGMTIDYRPEHNYVSRGALKLVAALQQFELSPEGLVCLDIGASTGGFTEVLLLNGAKTVYAVDVGHQQLHPRIAGNTSVIRMEGVNGRDLHPAMLREPPEAIVADVSFISLKLVLPAALALAARKAWLIALIKPQFEVGRAKVGRGGIVRSEADRIAARDDIAAWLSHEMRWTVEGVIESPITGGDGNKEYLLAAKKP